MNSFELGTIFGKTIGTLIILWLGWRWSNNNFFKKEVENHKGEENETD